jgi:hypothetical protein
MTADRACGGRWGEIDFRKHSCRNGTDAAFPVEQV